VVLRRQDCWQCAGSRGFVGSGFVTCTGRASCTAGDGRQLCWQVWLFGHGFADETLGETLGEQHHPYGKRCTTCALKALERAHGVCSAACLPLLQDDAGVNSPAEGFVMDGCYQVKLSMPCLGLPFGPGCLLISV
jgi:hypothetical protein